ncbi:MAG TPA: ABC transporter permease, partial [Gemmatimonadaceae bacterium]|nr:ABC transporter permease [Gemmatimonadaceae bacterium]
MLHFVVVDLRRHPGRTLLTASGVAIGVAMIVALLSLSAGIERSASGLIHLGGSELGLFQGGVGELTASSLPRSLVPRVRAQQDVADAAPIAVATNALPALGSFLVFGVEPDSFVMRRLVFLRGRPPAHEGEAAVGDGAARQLGLRVGESLA